MINKILQKRITIEASPAAVWAALTKPEISKEYFFDIGVHGRLIQINRKTIQ